MRDETHIEILGLATQIVAAYLANNAVTVTGIPPLLSAVYNALKSVETDSSAKILEPAVPIKKSIHPDYIVCLEDGKKLKMLKRHLRSAYGMSPDQYREKWKLDSNYPMVAPNYAKKRSMLAREIGLGTGAGQKSAAEKGSFSKRIR